jgi:hypothetical protein
LCRQNSNIGGAAPASSEDASRGVSAPPRLSRRPNNNIFDEVSNTAQHPARIGVIDPDGTSGDLAYSGPGQTMENPNEN